jgi:hypothetical protein
MAAATSQGKSFTIFLVGLMVAAAGLAFISTGIAKVALEGLAAVGKQPTALKLGGLAVVLAGRLIVIFGLNLTASVAGRMTTTLLGLAISLVGVLVILPFAANKNAIWKS